VRNSSVKAKGSAGAFFALMTVVVGFAALGAAAFAAGLAAEAGAEAFFSVGFPSAVFLTFSAGLAAFAAGASALPL